MTNKQFIKKDLLTGDFMENEESIINEALREKCHNEFLSLMYDGYDCIDEFYNDILNQ